MSQSVPPLTPFRNPLVSTVGNIVWIMLGGWLLFLEYLCFGFLLCCTIVGIPFGLQCMKLSFLALWPFGKEVTITPASTGCLHIGMNLLWLVLGGFWIALTHAICAVACALTIIYIPFAIQHLKLAAVALQPFGIVVR